MHHLFTNHFFKYVVFVITVLVSNLSYATHIMGGEVTYLYLDNNGASSTPFRYKIKFSIYTNCNAGSLFPTGIQSLAYSIQEVGAINSIQRTATGITKDITPSNISTCNGTRLACIFLNTFEDIVELEASTSGYVVIYGECCRNAEITNLTDPTSIGSRFTTTIPPTIYRNSSAQFDANAIPFICIGDTSTFIDKVLDPDPQDKLIISLGVPTNENLQEAQYNPGFSVLQPFGTTGYVSINASTGRTRMRSIMQGNYVVVVEIKEYRNVNGVETLLTTTRRELQVVTGSCKNNPPVFANTTNTYNLEVGKETCIDFKATDADNDNVTINASSSILETTGSLKPPYPTFESKTGKGTVTAPLCWSPTCEQVGSYQLTAYAKDDGCPELQTLKDFVINVVRGNSLSIENLKINGLSNLDTFWVCDNNYPMLTAGDSLSQVSNYTWKLNDTLLSHTKKILATNKLGQYNVEVTQSAGCDWSDSIWVLLREKPLVALPNDTSICFGGKAFLKSLKKSDYTYHWSPTKFVGDSIAENTFAQPLKTTYFVLQVTNVDCESKDSMLVEVKDELISKIKADKLYGDVPLLVNFSNNGYGESYNWDFGNGVKSTAQTSAINYTEEGEYTIQLKVSNSLGCSQEDTLRIVASNLFIPNIITPGNDGLNDSFKISNRGNNNRWTLEVFNRWGKQVYKSNNYRAEWSAEGETDGIYFYLIFDRGTSKTYKGWVEVVRE